MSCISYFYAMVHSSSTIIQIGHLRRHRQLNLRWILRWFFIVSNIIVQTDLARVLWWNIQPTVILVWFHHLLFILLLKCIATLRFLPVTFLILEATFKVINSRTHWWEDFISNFVLQGTLFFLHLQLKISQLTDIRWIYKVYRGVLFLLQLAALLKCI